MKICKNCGAHLVDSAAFCPLCGAEQQPPYAQQPDERQYENQNYTNRQNDYNSYDQPYDDRGYGYDPSYNNRFDPRYTILRNNISTVRTLGIVSIIGLFVMGLITLVCSIIGIIKGNEAIEQARILGDPLLLKQAQDAKQLNKVPLIILIVLIAIAVIGLIVYFALGYTFLSSGSYGY